jgi:hypothetical protein
MTNGCMNPRWYMPRFCGHLTSIWQGEPWLTTKLTSETSECYTTQVFCLDLRAHPGAPHQEISRWLKYQASPGWLRAKPTNGSSKTWLQRDESQTNKWQQITPLSVNQNNGTTWTPKSYPIAATKKMVTHSRKRGFTILEWRFDTLYLLWYAGYQHFSNLPRA